eukprot:6206631-Pleurochrysis_carterae.AAC.1
MQTHAPKQSAQPRTHARSRTCQARSFWMVPLVFEVAIFANIKLLQAECARGAAGYSGTSLP